MTNLPETCSQTPVSVAARSKAWVCDRSLAANVGSNPAGGMDACLFWVFCVVRERSVRRANHSSTERGVSSECDREAP